MGISGWLFRLSGIVSYFDVISIYSNALPLLLGAGKRLALIVCFYCQK
jgi:hypothetical protein